MARSEPVTTRRDSGSRRVRSARADRVAPGFAFSRREVAEFAGCSLQAIDKAIEQRVVLKRRKRGETVIGVDGLAVMVLLCSAKLDLPVKAKRLVRQWISRERPFANRGEQALELSEVVVLRVSEPARVVLMEAEAYAADRDRLIASDPRIFGGQPVIAGTRIPVRTVAERLDAGDTIDVLAEDYPHVEPRAFEVAALYARTHPRRGRPAKPWRHGTTRTSRGEAVHRREPVTAARRHRT
jgi:uncharacterized protein (DUF433 family)